MITYFRKDLVEIFVAWCPGLKNNEQRFNEGLMLIVGTLPIVIIGLFSGIIFLFVQALMKLLMQI